MIVLQVICSSKDIIVFRKAERQQVWLLVFENLKDLMVPVCYLAQCAFFQRYLCPPTLLFVSSLLCDLFLIACICYNYLLILLTNPISFATLLFRFAVRIHTFINS